MLVTQQISFDRKKPAKPHPGHMELPTHCLSSDGLVTKVLKVESVTINNYFMQKNQTSGMGIYD